MVNREGEGHTAREGRHLLDLGLKVSLVVSFACGDVRRRVFPRHL